MFVFLLAALLVCAAVHSYRLADRTPARIAETFLAWVLVGYCGLPMLVVSVGILAFPDRIAEMLPVGPPTSLLSFFGWAYLGMSLMAILALRYRGVYLIAPAVCWAVYFSGATVVHLHGGSASHGGILMTFATHGLISVILGVAIVAGGLLKRRS